MHVRRFLTTLLSMTLILAVAAHAGAAIRFDKVRYDAPARTPGRTRRSTRSSSC
jgi:hypothetical protein